MLQKRKELSSKIKFAFSYIILRQYKEQLERDRKDVNARMKNFRQQKV